MPDDLTWESFDSETRGKHFPVEQHILWELDIADWFKENGHVEVNDTPKRILVCGCDEKWQYPVGHELEPGFKEEEE